MYVMYNDKSAILLRQKPTEVKEARLGSSYKVLKIAHLTREQRFELVPKNKKLIQYINQPSKQLMKLHRMCWEL